MSLTVAFPNFSPDRHDVVGRPFACTLRIGDVGPTWVCVSGDLDVTSAPRLAEALRLSRSASSWGWSSRTTPRPTPKTPRLVVLDLRELSSTDLDGVHVIVAAATRFRRTGPRLMVVRGSEAVDRMFARSGAGSLVDIVDLDPPEPASWSLPALANTDDAA